MTTHRSSIVGAVQLLILGLSDTAAIWLLCAERVVDGDGECFVDHGLRRVSLRESP